MVGVRLEELTKVFGKSTIAVDNLDLEIKDKEFLVLLGPSGCGKTTTLRMIAGLEKPTSGSIYIGDKLVNDVSEKDRDVAMVFQTFALFPHMSAFNNIAFPLKMHKYRKGEIKKQVTQVAEMLQISHLLNRSIGQLSGGEAQRVAVGRALVTKPKVFLLDEPLANLDAKLRVHTRVFLKKLQKDIGITTICVTHDQAEAMTMADRVAVMHEGKLSQLGTPSDLYDHPADLFVAGFIGSPAMNFVDCTLEKGSFLVSEHFKLEIPEDFGKEIEEHATTAEVILGVRPHDILLHEKETPNSANVEVYAIEPLGNETIIDLMLGDKIVKVVVPPTYQTSAGEKVWMTFRMERVHILDKKTEKVIV
jgi:multiple sugar transport system ATP-binding protein